MAALRSGVSDLPENGRAFGTWGALVRRYAATLIDVLLWTALGVAIALAWIAAIYLLVRV